MISVFDDWVLDFQTGIPAYRQIIQRIQSGVSAGLLREGDQLPTIRALHQQLGINPNTVARAYRELQLLGTITSEQGSGCYVAPTDKADRERQAKIATFASAVATEAREQGIELTELIAHLSTQPAK